VTTAPEVAAEVAAQLGDGEMTWLCEGCRGMCSVDVRGVFVAHDAGGAVPQECPGTGTPPVQQNGLLWHWTPDART